MLFQNEIILIASVFVYFGAVLALFRIFGKTGLYMWTIICTIAANIEVLILVHAFGMDQTLGNVIFASSFLTTDIISEIYGKKKSNRCVCLGIVTNVVFILISQSWFLFVPAEADTMSAPIRTVFANTPRVMGASLLGYVVSEFHDVWAYHFWWDLTAKKTGDKKSFLWLRNNGSTLVSQLINTIVFNVTAFAGVFDTKTVISIVISSYVIYIVTSLLDTPFLYAARAIAPKVTGKPAE